MAKPNGVRVNLDALILREDLAVTDEPAETFEAVSGIAPANLESTSVIASLLRKPDFQRETAQWSPDQVVTLVQCFLEGDLIPSIILWRSPSNLFVIDGCHRLSALRAWVEDDYGDGEISRRFFGADPTRDQLRAAVKTRALLKERGIPSWRELTGPEQLPGLDRRHRIAAGTRTLPVQWLTGLPEKAEASFFRINKQGTQLDDIEELLLKNRAKPVAIAARAVFRAARGHRYWSAFERTRALEIEAAARHLHQTLFDPDLESPIKTLDLPLAGARGARAGFKPLADLLLIASQNQQGTPAKLSDSPDDPDGEATLRVLVKAVALAERLTGNDRGSLGLHPAIYFYGPTGQHSAPMFLGTCRLLARKNLENDKLFWRRFTDVRADLEGLLVEHKGLIADLLQKATSFQRVAVYEQVLAGMISRLVGGELPDDAAIVALAGMEGKVVAGRQTSTGKDISDDTKSAVFITAALAGQPRCAVCRGYLPARSISYDHRVPRREGGTGDLANVQLTHPYCNQAYKG